MKINQSQKIDDKKGDWIILTDYGSEGFSVTSQHKTPEEAIKGLGEMIGDPQTIVRLAEFSFSCID